VANAIAAALADDADNRNWAGSESLRRRIAAQVGRLFRFTISSADFSRRMDSTV
jgi:hypothetical protein